MLTAIALGILVGLILALTGAGGAIIAVPLLMFGFHWDVIHAAPVALLAVCSSGLVGTALGLRAGIVRYKAALLMAGVGSALAPLGLWVAHRLPATPLTLLFAAVLVFVALRMFQQAGRELSGLPALEVVTDAAACKLNEQTGRFEWTALCTRTLALAGAVAGFLSGLFGVGGGFVIVPALKRSTDLPMHAVVATALMVVALVSASTVVSSIVAGRLDVAVGIPFACGAVTAMLAGRRLAHRLAGPRLQQGFAVLTLMVAGGLLVKVLL
ncbi:MAG: sulfite exporter TauE/SafE family protein [Stagnimonas sp.]|nr:sulfite exporter TauE/SafE family protein [Stagnimonas sp.]